MKLVVEVLNDRVRLMSSEGWSRDYGPETEQLACTIRSMICRLQLNSIQQLSRVFGWHVTEYRPHFVPTNDHVVAPSIAIKNNTADKSVRVQLSLYGTRPSITLIDHEPPTTDGDSSTPQQVETKIDYDAMPGAVLLDRMERLLAAFTKK